MVNNPFGYLFSPRSQWEQLALLPLPAYRSCILYPLFIAIFPCIAWYYGTTTAGWTVGGGESIRLTADSALKIVCAFYAAIIISLSMIGYSIHWMSETYGSQTSISKGIAIASYAATPLFLAGVFGFYPLLWLDLMLGIAAVCWSVYLLFTGIPIVMNIPAERGFLYASAIIGVCLVILMGLMGATVILWDMGFMPVFTD